MSATTPRLLKRDTSEMLFVAPVPGSRLEKLVESRPEDKKNFTAILQAVFIGVRLIIDHEHALKNETGDASDSEEDMPRPQKTLGRRLARGTLKAMRQSRVKPELLPVVQDFELPSLQISEEKLAIMDQGQSLTLNHSLEDVIDRIKGVAKRLLDLDESPVREITRTDPSGADIPVEHLAAMCGSLSCIVIDQLTSLTPIEELFKKSPAEVREMTTSMVTGVLEGLTLAKLPPTAETFFPSSKHIISIDLEQSGDIEAMRQELITKLEAHPLVREHNLLSSGAVLLSMQANFASTLTQMLLTQFPSRASHIGLILRGLVDADGRDLPCLWAETESQSTMARYNPLPDTDSEYSAYFTSGTGARYPKTRSGTDLHDLATYLLNLDVKRTRVMLRGLSGTPVVRGTPAHAAIKKSIDSVLLQGLARAHGELPEMVADLPSHIAMETMRRVAVFQRILPHADSYGHVSAMPVVEVLEAAGLIVGHPATFMPYHFTVNNCSSMMPGGLARVDETQDHYQPLLRPFEFELKINK
ncbi:hypothetical protein J8273_7478 [Carpediemonas membranifera]|uniref:Uncharacterized protein n=1 Tax=Carpediemonas membranifera TaxID=201153 RepID=A0A8J6AZT2_9EUKA|nr:hypothetical protein J8273_7478 [Carpediemonas membranifera]|eukprot:KAG9391204.1 hypothetical protein J8273_7478 [Carpediemonas membranifera]